MGQLARRLREVLPLYGVDPAVHQAELDAIDATERGDPQRAHALFEAVRDRVARARHDELWTRLHETAPVTGAPMRDLTGFTLREVDRAIAELEAALRHARAIAEALQETRAHLAGLEARALALDFTPFAVIEYADLPASAARAEAHRRAAAQEARIEARLRSARQRAARLDPARVEVPDAGSARVPDPREADALLAATEARLREAEALNAAHARVARLLRDAGVREFKRETAKALQARADALAAQPDRAAATEALRGLERDAEALRREAAALSQRAARARRTGGTGPERERRRGDMLDGYG